MQFKIVLEYDITLQDNGMTCHVNCTCVFCVFNNSRPFSSSLSPWFLMSMTRLLRMNTQRPALCLTGTGDQISSFLTADPSAQINAHRKRPVAPKTCKNDTGLEGEGAWMGCIWQELRLTQHTVVYLDTQYEWYAIKNVILFYC